MDENRNNTARWLQYLLYAGIAALVNSLLGIFGLEGLARWIGLAVSAATVYLLFMLSGSNPRYRNAAIFYAVALGGTFINNAAAGLLGSICGIIAEYQEYHAHGELIQEKDPKLADKWKSLFAMQLAVTFIGILLTGLLVGVLVAATDMSEDVILPIVTVFVAALGIGLSVLYLSYLNRTIKLVETETPE